MDIHNIGFWLVLFLGLGFIIGLVIDINSTLNEILKLQEAMNG